MAVLTFHGAAQQVTGSCHMLESAAVGRILLDCGLQQGGDAAENGHDARRNLPFDPASLDAIVLSHAHLDHCGLLPYVVHGGFRGPIHCTRATEQLLPVMLRDSLHLYEKDLQYENLRRLRRGEEAIEPAYTEKDVLRTLELCRGHRYRQSFTLGEEAEVTFHDAGHILGSAIVELKLREMNETRTLVFSGDLGKRDSVLMNDPETLGEADIVLMEGTYGNRDHRSAHGTIEQLAAILHETWEKKGCVMMPAFAVGRTQEILYHLALLHKQGRLDGWQIFLDSPMAIEITRIYGECIHMLDQDDLEKIGGAFEDSIRDLLPQLRFSRTQEESMAINKISHGAIVIAGSGMCTGGRIRHHFKQRIWSERNAVIFAGFQARGTLGRALVDGASMIRIFREEYAVRARIETLGGFSAHAGQSELMDWIAHFKSGPRVLLVHGEPEALDALSVKLWKDRKIAAEIPYRGQKIFF